jgi:glucokinase
MTTVAGLDLGATTVRTALADERGRLLATTTEPTPGDRKAVVDVIQRSLTRAADGAGIPLDAVAAVGIGSMGPLDHAAGAVVDPPNLPGVDEVPVVEAVSGVHDGEIVLFNDAVAAAIGERFYADDPPANLVYLTISSGIGAGAIVDGNVLHGATGNAAEMGHITVAPDSDQRCGCGDTGHWEALCSGRAIPETARTVAAEAGVDTEFDLADLTAPDLFDDAGSDPLADRVLDRLAAYNTMGVAALVHAYDPAVVHVGGGVAANNPEAVVDPIRRRLPAHLVGETPTVAVTPLGADATLRGAVAGALGALDGDYR